MENGIVYVCNSTNNKNVRGSELKILRKYEDKLYFEFGESESNIKKRFYNDVETLNKDFKEIEKIKNRLEKESIKTSEEEPKIETVENVEKTNSENQEKYKRAMKRKNIF